MAKIVIVTDKCYLLCEAINYMSLNEGECDEWYEEVKVKTLGKKKKTSRGTKWKHPTVAEAQLLDDYRLYSLNIDFIPTPTQNSNGNSARNSNDTSTVTINVRGKTACQALFKDVVNQIREQLPDNKFLDTLVERFFAELEGEKK